MPNWTESMQQTYEYYTVDPGTWKDVKKILTVKSSTIDWDKDAATLGSSTMDIADSIGETYVRTYLVTIQNGVSTSIPLGTFLVQTTPSSFDGKTKSISLDAYTPLLELNEKKPPIGYFIPKGANIMDEVYRITRDNCRAPVVKPSCSETLFSDFVADIEDTWLTFLNDLMGNAKYEFNIDELGRILYSPKQETESLQPVVTYNDDDISILHADINMEQDLYGIPNVVEVVYSNGGTPYYARVVNDDPNSPTSTVSRGREIIHRVTDPNMIGNPTNDQIDEYAVSLLKELSSIENVLTYKHGYCSVRNGDCVRINYKRAGLINVKAKVISQSIACVPGCTVTEKAVYTTKLWR